MRTVLVPFDDSPMARDAFTQALADYPDADIELLHVIDFSRASYGVPLEGTTGSYLDAWETSARNDAESLFAEAEETAAATDRFSGTLSTAIETGSPAQTIIKRAEQIDADYVVMGSHGRSGASRVLLGSVAESVVRRAPCPVLVVR